jgi:hypothetical protein
VFTAEQKEKYYDKNIAPILEAFNQIKDEKGFTNSHINVAIVLATLNLIQKSNSDILKYFLPAFLDGMIEFNMAKEIRESN